MSRNDVVVTDLRTKFLNELEDFDEDKFHPVDINKVKTDDNYLRRFLAHNDQDEKNAFNMLWETCEWRKKIGANDISEENVNRDILESGSIFAHGRDKDGKTLLIFKTKKHVKGAYDFEDHKRCIVYWLERLERETNGDKISLFFDMDGANLSNMDLEYTKYLIGLLKSYYPHFLNYIIIFEMAWVLNAMLKIIKTWLPPKAVEKMKSLNKSNLKEYVDIDNALRSWGGKDDYVFSFEPEQGTAISLTSTSGDDNRKKVHFADGSFKQDRLNESGFEDTPTSLSNLESTSLNVSPSDIMVFTHEGNEISSSITLKNNDSHCISYKIKTTAPEKFRVRPSTCVLPPGAKSTINVLFHSGYHLQTLPREKFLIMSIPVENSNLTQQELNDLWKQVNEKDINQHRLRCSAPSVVSNDFDLKNGSAFNSQPTDDQKMMSKLCSDITKLNTYVSTLKEEMKLIRRQQWIIIFSVIILICSLAYIIYNDYFNPGAFGENCWAESRRHH